ncbi:glycosyltransferase family 4 protein [Anatilimnocola floriformis]|uniref:glycosyltransferase family 4 protein n=1 Tax=Anatilimnocola floriformis TaxID=2948575 RepID=UPI0020C32DFF|nr:glycosyltransferase family 4 protein [Anatilimnocola floriformis]
MRLSITSDYRFAQTPDGTIWTDGPCHHAHWTRYLSVFGAVNVLARVRDVETADARWQRANGELVRFSRLPHYAGPWQYLWKSWRVCAAACAAVKDDDALILNVPGQIASCVQDVLRTGRPYGLQVLGNPHDVFAPGVVRHPARPFIRWWSSRRLRKQSSRATAALYVTERTLQQSYPCPAAEFGVSDVDLPPEAFRSRTITETRPFMIATVGTMSQMYKGFDVLIGALANCSSDIRLVIVGDGKFRPVLEEQVAAAKLQDRVEFRGQMPTGEPIRQVLDGADLFVLPSRTEGLPRALVEAMARGLPCLASNVGGIPELLAAEDLLPPGDAAALEAAIQQVANDRDRQQQMSDRNLRRAKDFQAETLQTRRQTYWQHLCERTAEYQRRATTLSLQEAR